MEDPNHVGWTKSISHQLIGDEIHPPRRVPCFLTGAFVLKVSSHMVYLEAKPLTKTASVSVCPFSVVRGPSTVSTPRSNLSLESGGPGKVRGFSKWKQKNNSFANPQSRFCGSMELSGKPWPPAFFPVIRHAADPAVPNSEPEWL